MIRASSLNDNYPQVRLGDVVEFLDHMRKPVTAKDRVAGPYPYYGANGQQDSVEDYIFNEPLVLLAEDGGNFGDPNRTIAYQVEGKCWVNNHAHVLRPTSKIDIRYLCRHIELYDVRSHINGATREKLNKGAAQEIIISLPPLEEQKRIAAILDKADALRRKRQKAIDLTDQLLRSVFLDMFGDPVANPKGWKEGCLGDAVHFAKDGPHVSPKYSEFGIPFLSTRHVKTTGIVWNDLKYISTGEAAIQWKKCKPQYGDVLYTKGGTTGIASHVDFHEEFAVWVHVALLRPNVSVVNSVWLTAMLNSAYCYAQSQSYTHGATNKDLGLKRMVKIRMFLPPLEEQDKYAVISGKLKTKIERYNKNIQLLERLFLSLTQQAFRGELTKQTKAA